MWFPIKGYEDRYWINTKGEVRNSREWPLQVLNTHDRGGSVRLTKDGETCAYHIEWLLHSNIYIPTLEKLALGLDLDLGGLCQKVLGSSKS